MRKIILSLAGLSFFLLLLSIGFSGTSGSEVEQPIRSPDSTHLPRPDGIPPFRSGTASQAKLDIKEFTLKNGMKVLILERHASPTVAASLVFRVGSVNEHPGITGISHIVEHMLFKGTKTIGTKDYKGELPILEKTDELMEKLIALRKTKTAQSTSQPTVEDQEIKALETELAKLTKINRTYRIPDELKMIYRRNGARGLNASTSNEMTWYYCELPSNKLELWAWVESDRFSNPIWREFYQEKDVIMEERRMRSEVSPRGLLYEQFMATAYVAHPLRWPIIGWRSDIKAITKKQLDEHFQQYYAPNNAIAVIVGDVDVMGVLAIMRRYFEPIPSSPSPPPPVATVEPPQLGERRVCVKFNAQPMMYIGYHTTTIGHPDDYTLDIISEILSGGRTSRFYRNLILEKNLCLSIDTYNDVGKYPGLFIIPAIPRHPHTTQEAGEAIYRELERLKTEPVSEAELARAKKRLEAGFLRGLNSNSRLARMIGHYEVLNSHKYIYDVTLKRNAVTTEDIKKVASKYFVPNNRTVATLVPKEKSELPSK